MICYFILIFIALRAHSALYRDVSAIDRVILNKIARSDMEIQISCALYGEAALGQAYRILGLGNRDPQSPPGVSTGITGITGRWIS